MPVRGLGSPQGAAGAAWGEGRCLSPGKAAPERGYCQLPQELLQPGGGMGQLRRNGRAVGTPHISSRNSSVWIDWVLQETQPVRQPPENPGSSWTEWGVSHPCPCSPPPQVGSPVGKAQLGRSGCHRVFLDEGACVCVCACVSANRIACARRGDPGEHRTPQDGAADFSSSVQGRGMLRVSPSVWL